MRKSIGIKLFINVLIIMLLCVGINLFRSTTVFAAENDSLMYVFNNDTYAKYDFNTDTQYAGYPLITKDHWPGFPWSTFDTAFTGPNGKIYFFKGSEYIRYDIATDQVDEQPRSIAAMWPGLNWTNIDAAVYWPSNGKVYFFKGDQYIRYDFNGDKVEAQLPIAGNWKGLTYTNIDSAIVAPNGKAYFFKGDKYLRFDVATDQVDQAELPILGHFNFPSAFTQRVDAIVTWPTKSLLRQQVVDYAKTFLGTPYLYGGTTPAGFDCSGFTQYVYNHFGINITRTTYTQVNQGVYVSRDQLLPGDLVFFYMTDQGPGHVGIYIGNGQFIHAPHSGDVVRIADLSGYDSVYVTARRIIN